MGYEVVCTKRAVKDFSKVRAIGTFGPEASDFI